MFRLSFNYLANSESDCEEPEEGGSGHLTEHGESSPLSVTISDLSRHRMLHYSLSSDASD